MTVKTQPRGRHFTTDSKAPHHEPQATAVTTVEAQALTVSAYAEDAGVGLEDVSSDEMLIPFVRLVQPTSKALDQTHPSYDESLRAGMMIHTALGTVFSQKVGFGFIPALRDSSYTEWVPQVLGGGFRGAWAHDDERVLKLKAAQGAFKALDTGNGTELVETYSLYGTIVPREEKTGTWLVDEATNGVISFTSTQIKKYKMLVTRLQALCGAGSLAKFPIFAFRWNVTTIPEKNTKGSYFGWKFSLDGTTATDARMVPSDHLYQMAKELNSLVRSGTARADFAQSDVLDTAAASGGHGPSQHGDPGASDEEIPF